MPTPQERRNLPANLQALCQSSKSASAVAREIGVNRQQFEKYLTGRSFPSQNMRWRIAKHFQVTVGQLTDDPDDFAGAPKEFTADTPHDEFRIPISTPDELATLRSYVGVFQTYFLTPAWPGQICVGLVFVREDDRQIKTVYFNRLRDPESNALHRSRLYGRLLLRGERLFLIEATRKTEDRLSETILFPSHGHSPRYVTGMSIGLTWRPHRMPYASRTIWRRVGSTYDTRYVMRQCGIFPSSHAAIDPIVSNFFGEDLRAYSMSTS